MKVLHESLNEFLTAEALPCNHYIWYDVIVHSSEALAYVRKGIRMDIADVRDCDLEKYITDIMLDIGVPAHLKGYFYLRDAILLSGKDMAVVGSVTKLLYPAIAKRFHTTDQKVERAIRNVIEVSWARGNACTFQQVFGYSPLEGRTRPTNSEYIARIADKVRLDYKVR